MIETQLLKLQRRRKPLSPFRTKEKVIEGLRAAAATIWNNDEKLLPSGTTTYQQAIMAYEPITGNSVRKLFPGLVHVTSHFSTMVEAWAALGFTVASRASRRHATTAKLNEQIARLRNTPRLPNRPRGTTETQTRIKRPATRDPSTGRVVNQGGVRVSKFSELPDEGFCLLCESTKPLAEMVVTHLRKEGMYQMRPRCKNCHNDNERGHRREWKRNYLRAWRARNKDVDDSYRENDPNLKEQNRVRMARRFNDKHYALLIQGRLRRLLNLRVSTPEAENLLERFGPCYPSQFGLTEEGRKRAERLRSTMRREGTPYKTVELRMLVYEEGWYIPPNKQPLPYQNAAEKLRKVQRERRKTIT